MLLRAASRLILLLCSALQACLFHPPVLRAQDAPFPPANDVPLTAPGQSPQEPNPPTIQVTTRIVVLDDVVVDKQNKVVKRDFSRDDFTIAEDTQPQTIRSFEPPSTHRMPRGGEPIVNSAADLKKIGDAPITVMVLDELNGRFEDMAYAREK